MMSCTARESIESLPIQKERKILAHSLETTLFFHMKKSFIRHYCSLLRQKLFV